LQISQTFYSIQSAHNIKNLQNIVYNFFFVDEEALPFFKHKEATQRAMAEQLLELSRAAARVGNKKREDKKREDKKREIVKVCKREEMNAMLALPRNRIHGKRKKKGDITRFSPH
jgi:hypothetical protein